MIDPEIEENAEALAKAVIERMTNAEREELTREALAKGVSETDLVYRALVILMERAPES